MNRILLSFIFSLLSVLCFGQSVTWVTTPTGTDSMYWEYADYTIPPGMRVDSVFGAFTRPGYPVDEEDFYLNYCAGTNMNCTTPVVPFDYSTTNTSLYGSWIDLTAFPLEDDGIVRVGLPTFTGQILQYDSLFYLPDGSGANYETTITVNSYGPTDVVISGTDIGAMCVTMEHSYLGDLEMIMECPNGQTTTIFNSYNGNGDLVPGGFNGGGTYLGDAFDNNIGNPGNGWQYCFDSNNATFDNMGNEFAAANTIPTTISIGPAMNPNGIYLPEGDWNDFIGCPLNGDWKLIIRDNLSIDDGYIFGWGFNLDPATAPQPNAVWDSVGFALSPGITWGVEDAATNRAFSIAPNPASESIQIVSDQMEKIGEVQLFDLSGRSVLRTNSTQKIAIGNLPIGLYILHITDKNGMLLHRDKLEKSN